MARKRSERVTRLVEGFYTDWKNGIEIEEIEKKYGVSKGYSYGLLDEI